MGARNWLVSFSLASGRRRSKREKSERKKWGKSNAFCWPRVTTFLNFDLSLIWYVMTSLHAINAITLFIGQENCCVIYFSSYSLANHVFLSGRGNICEKRERRGKGRDSSAFPPFSPSLFLRGKGKKSHLSNKQLCGIVWRRRRERGGRKATRNERQRERKLSWKAFGVVGREGKREGEKKSHYCCFASRKIARNERKGVRGIREKGEDRLFFFFPLSPHLLWQSSQAGRRQDDMPQPLPLPPPSSFLPS